MPLQSLRLVNRSPNRPIKKLPPSIDLPQNATVEDVKIMIARISGFRDHNRIGLFDPSTKKTLKNRKALISDEQAVVSTGRVLVKDLGMQVPWRVVFFIEYLGPILIHLLVQSALPNLYNTPAFRGSQAQMWSLGMILAHFAKREYETVFIHKFSANTMPVFNVFKNSAFYWAISGLLCALSIYHPRSMAAKADNHLVSLVGLVVYLIGQSGNAAVHLYLSSLRPAGSTERKIPKGYGFGLVTCPNYMYEIMSWIGIIIVSRDWTVALFIAIGGAQMWTWAKDKERAYRKEFGDKYRKKRSVIIPGLL